MLLLKKITELTEASLLHSIFFFAIVFNNCAFKFTWKYALLNYQKHNFDQQMVASFAINLESS